MSSPQTARTGLQLRSTIRRDGQLELRLVSTSFPPPADDEVVVRVEASPINPSDLGVLFGPADPSTVKVTGAGTDAVVTARVPEALLASVAGRLDQELPTGNEGAGTVIDAGSSPSAQQLVGKTVAIFGGAMYAQYRVAKAAQCLVLPPGTAAAEGASCFVNPLTALGMVETMRMEGHTALVHTAAASNLGQMLLRICLADGIPLVNIVRREEQAKLLRSQGAAHVCVSADPGFRGALVQALSETGATIAFDAVGGGDLASRLLAAMEAAASAKATEYSRYGSTVHKQVYIYGSLDRGPTLLQRAYGMAWGIGGWLLPNFLQKVGGEVAQRLRQRVAAELKTTFASHYAHTVSLAEALQPEAIAVYGRQATGEKYLVEPQKGL